MTRKRNLVYEQAFITRRMLAAAKQGHPVTYGTWVESPAMTIHERTERTCDLGYATYEDAPACVPVLVIPLAMFGDYDNSCAVERSNARVLREEFPRHTIPLSGWHGRGGTLVLGTPDTIPEELRERLDGLADYPLLDEQDESEMEMEMESEAWDDYGRDDFARALIPLLAELDPGHEHDLDLSTDIGLRDAAPEPGADLDLADLFREGADAFNLNGGSGYQIEPGGSVYFYTEQWISEAGEGPESYEVSPHTWFRESRARVRSKLVLLARMTGVPDTDDAADREACEADLLVAKDARLQGRIAESDAIIHAMRSRYEIVEEPDELTPSEVAS